jgi:hypothetical protein
MNSNKGNSTIRYELKIKLFAVCVILSRNLIGNSLFMEFNEDFKRFEANYCCLPSKDIITELHRAFYYSNIYDYQMAEDMNKILG